MKRSLTEVANFYKITVQSNYEPKPYEVPPDRKVGERKVNEMEQCGGKGSISFLLPAAI